MEQASLSKKPPRPSPTAARPRRLSLQEAGSAELKIQKADTSPNATEQKRAEQDDDKLIIEVYEAEDEAKMETTSVGEREAEANRRCNQEVAVTQSPTASRAVSFNIPGGPAEDAYQPPSKELMMSTIGGGPGGDMPNHTASMVSTTSTVGIRKDPNREFF